MPVDGDFGWQLVMHWAIFPAASRRKGSQMHGHKGMMPVA
jgi:hypothetical protein